MKIDFRPLWNKILNPPVWVKSLTFIVTILSATGSLLTLLIDYENSIFSILAYTLFGIAGLSLAYSVYLIVPLIPKAKRRIQDCWHFSSVGDTLVALQRLSS